ncbi:aldehyde dehydrogenase family protein, partial [uncultured Nevskia sp.]|uniref:aldehyde dehydrogenase family protein n=1 Tax=uncultured Nevskia sp. TaxID=228950 RepID=UPI0025FAD33E
METSLLIDNTPRAAAEGKTFARRHPTDDRLITTVAAASIADARAAAESAGRAYAVWSQTGPTERRRVLLRAADLVEEKVAEFVSTMALEVGASELWSRFNVGLTASLFREAASLATQIQGETIPTDKPGTLSMTIRQSVGVILSIAPWNGPVVLAARALAYPLVCGNTVVFRASETSPRTHALLVEILHAAGLPAGALNLLTTAPADAPAVIDELIAHPAIRRINFTGSTRVGRIIAQKAASHLKRCLLELGG